MHLIAPISQWSKSSFFRLTLISSSACVPGVEDVSFRILNSVWNAAPYRGSTLLILLAIADYANDQGLCFPSVSAIARKTRLTTRQASYILRRLREDEVIAVEPGGGRGVHSRYHLSLKWNSVKSNSVKQLSVKSAAETLKSTSQNSEICDSAIRKNRHEPSIEPSGASCSDLDKPASEHSLVLFPCVGRGSKTYGVTRQQVADWSEAFPAVDVMSELRKARAWTEANSKKRKTSSGMARFLVNWLTRAQNSSTPRPLNGSSNGSSAGGKLKFGSIDEKPPGAKPTSGCSSSPD